MKKMISIFAALVSTCCIANRVNGNEVIPRALSQMRINRQISAHSARDAVSQLMGSDSVKQYNTDRKQNGLAPVLVVYESKKEPLIPVYHSTTTSNFIGLSDYLNVSFEIPSDEGKTFSLPSGGNFDLALNTMLSPDDLSVSINENVVSIIEPDLKSNSMWSLNLIVAKQDKDLTFSDVKDLLHDQYGWKDTGIDYIASLCRNCADDVIWKRQSVPKTVRKLLVAYIIHAQKASGLPLRFQVVPIENLQGGPMQWRLLSF